MRIGINGYEAVVPRFGFESYSKLPVRVGSAEYCYQLLKVLNKIDKKNEYLVYFPIQPSADLPKESDRWQYEVIRKRTLWTLFDVSLVHLLGKKPDVFFSPTHYLPLFTGVPSVVSILDLSYIHMPPLFKIRDLWQLRLWTAYSVRKARRIITISKSSKDDIIKHYTVPEEKVVVVYPGVKSKVTMKNSKLLKEKYGVSGEYILFVGTLQPRKNVSRLVEAFARIIRPRGVPQAGRQTSQPRLTAAQHHLGGGRMDSPEVNSLVILGKKGWMYEEILDAPKRLEITDKVTFLDNVPDEDLPLFYTNALCFVLPSLYEGFGLPILEAMQHGCPVVTSNISSLPEAGGDAALYVDPYNTQDIADKISMVLADKTLRQEMIKKGFAQVKKFSWEKAARETLKVLEEVAKKA